MKQTNPFPVVGYYGPDLFCDREKEISKLSRNLKSGINTTLISVRRMGKTALIHRVFDEILREEEAICLYVDLYPTGNIRDMARQLATAVMKRLPGKKSAGKKFLDFVRSLRPVITYDPLTGAPEIRFEYSSVSDYELTVAALLNFLEQQKLPVYMAFDEFQVVATYEESNTEAVLRTLIQSLKNVHFIFSGSNRHMMTEIFSNTKRPFFASTRIVTVAAIEADIYSAFITEKFAAGGRTVEPEAVSFILEWTRRHTYYTQSVCNALYGYGARSIDLTRVKSICSEILEEQEKTFLQYRNLLTANQWQVLTAVAKEGKVYNPQAWDFISRYSLVSPASSKRALDSLLEKEMLYSDTDKGGSFYAVYDQFLSRWLERS